MEKVIMKDLAPLSLRDHDIPIVFLSSHTEPEIVARTEKITAYGFIVKNSSTTVFQALIKMVFKLFESKSREKKNESQGDVAFEALRESEERFRSIINTSPDGISITDMNGRIIMASPALLAIAGCERKEEILGHLFTDFVSPEDIHRASSDVSRMPQNSKMGLSEYHGLRADGSAVAVEVNGDFVRDANGQPTQMVFIIRDISERKRAEEEINRQLAEKVILLKEVHHRIKNNIASIGGLLTLHMQASTSPEAVAALQDAIGRVDSMRLLYEKLLLGGDFQDTSTKNYIESLATSVVSLFPDQAKVKLNLDVDDFKLGPKRLFPLGIIINELLTNIMKYAFVGKKSGTIKLSLAKDGARVTLTLQDNGAGLPSGFDFNASKGFGLTLVKMLSQQLKGTFSIEKHKGIHCRLEFDI